MYWQHEYLREAANMGRDSTYKIDLPDEGLLSGIFFRITSNGVSGAFSDTEKWRICDYIEKVEVIANGSIVIKSLSGTELQALQSFDIGITSLDYWHSYATGSKKFNFPLLFGRKLYDDDYGLDLSKWNNVEIKITNNGTSTEFGGDFAVSMLCMYKRGDVTGFKGYLRTEEWRTWSTVQNETKYLELPIENKIRRIIMQIIPDVSATEVEKTAMHNLVDDLELSLQTGVLRVYKGGIDDLMRLNALFLKKLQMTVPQYYLDVDQGRNIGMGYVLGGAWGAGEKGNGGAGTIPTLEGMRTSFTQKPETYEGDSPIHGIHVGLCPENCVFFPFYYKDDPGNYLDPSAEKTVKLNLHTRNISSAADGKINIILDRIV